MLPLEMIAQTELTELGVVTVRPEAVSPLPELVPSLISVAVLEAAPLTEDMESFDTTPSDEELFAELARDISRGRRRIIGAALLIALFYALAILANWVRL